MGLKSKKNTYWYCQIFGWSFFVVLNVIFFRLTYKTTLKDYIFYFLSIPLGIFISHVYKLTIVKHNILRLKIPIQLSLILFFSFFKAIIFFFITYLLSLIFSITDTHNSFIYILTAIINLTVVFCLWNIIYFGFHYFKKKSASIDCLFLRYTNPRLFSFFFIFDNFNLALITGGNHFNYVEQAVFYNF